MAAKILPLTLPTSIYQRIEQEAKREDRNPEQQARHLIKQALGMKPEAMTVASE